MIRQMTHEEYPNWVTICRRVRVWEERPEPGSLKSLMFLGASDSGRLECRDSTIRFEGKRNRIEISDIKDISEVRVRSGLYHFFLYWLFCSVACLLMAGLLIPMGPVGSTIWKLVGAIILASIGAIIYWPYHRVYGRWTCITYHTSDGEPRQLCFLAFPLAGGSRKLYKTLLEIKLAAP